MAERQHQHMQQQLLLLLVAAVVELIPLQEPRQHQQQGRLQTALEVGRTGATAGAAPRLRSQAPRRQQQTPRAEGQQRQPLVAAAGRGCMQ